MEDNDEQQISPKTCLTPGCGTDVRSVFDYCGYCRRNVSKVPKECEYYGCSNLTRGKYCREHVRRQYRCTYFNMKFVRCPNYGVHPLACHAHKKHFRSDVLEEALKGAAAPATPI